MLPGFKDHTAPLSQKELETLLPGFLKGLSKRVGKANAITSTQIIKGFERKGIKITDVTVRKVIAHIRDNDLVDGLLVASSAGYYISHDPKDILRWIESLTGRINKITDIKQKAQAKYRKYAELKQNNLYQ